MADLAEPPLPDGTVDFLATAPFETPVLSPVWLEVDVDVAHDRIVAVRAEPVVDGGGYTPDEPFAFRMTTYRMPEVYCTQGQNLPSLRKKRTYNPVLSAVPVNVCPAPGL